VSDVSVMDVDCGGLQMKEGIGTSGNVWISECSNMTKCDNVRRGCGACWVWGTD
jgi:hypothetical protein